jgi:hypothetical protein
MAMNYVDSSGIKNKNNLELCCLVFKKVFKLFGFPLLKTKPNYPWNFKTLIKMVLKENTGLWEETLYISILSTYVHCISAKLR